MMHTIAMMHSSPALAQDSVELMSLYYQLYTPRSTHAFTQVFS
jgi:hypothetical protein